VEGWGPGGDGDGDGGGRDVLEKGERDKDLFLHGLCNSALHRLFAAFLVHLVGGEVVVLRVVRVLVLVQELRVLWAAMEKAVTARAGHLHRGKFMPALGCLWWQSWQQWQ
jgi:hypothetical protein